MITLPLRVLASAPGAKGQIQGATWSEVAPFYADHDPLRQVERASIRTFMEKHAPLLQGRVLDFGAGKQPYKDLVRGEYVPLDQGDLWPAGPFDAVMCNQVTQYVTSFSEVLDELWMRLRDHGSLVMTYATNWPEVEETDSWRWTKAGMTRLLDRSGFTITAHEMRAEVAVGTFKFALGYGVVATR